MKIEIIKNPHVDRRCNAVEREQTLMSFGQKRVVLQLHSEAPLLCQTTETRARLCSQIRNLQHVRKNVIAIKTHQWIGIKKQRRHTGYKHHIEAHLIKKTFV